MKLSRKLISVFVATALCAGLTACHTGEDTKWVAQLGEETIPAGVYINMLYSSYYTVTNELAGEDGSLPKKPLSEQVDGVPVSQKITEEAKKALQEYLAVEQKAKEMNVSVSEADQSQIDMMIENYWNYVGENYTANGISKDSYRLSFLNNAKKSQLFDAIYGENGTEPVPESELKDKYNKDVAKVIMITMPLSANEDADAKAEEDKALRERYDSYYKQLQDGTDMEEVLYQFQKDESDDPDSVEKPEKGMSYTFVIRDTSAYAENVTDAIFNAALGTATKAETDETLYLFVRYDANENPEDFTSRKAALTKLLREDAFTAKLEEWAAGLDVQMNDAALSRYTPNKLKLES